MKQRQIMFNPISQMMEFLGISKEEKIICFNLFRLGIYFFLLMLLAFGMWGIANIYGTKTFEEYGLVENLQIIMLILSGIIFLYMGWRRIFCRPLSFLFASLTFFASIRELDAFFDRILPIISWKFAFLFPLLGLWFLFKKRHEIRRSAFNFFNSPSFYLMLSAMIIFLPLAQCIGHKKMIVDVLGGAKNAIYVRRLIEESMELMAYVLILLSAIELRWSAKKDK